MPLVGAFVILGIIASLVTIGMIVLAAAAVLVGGIALVFYFFKYIHEQEQKADRDRELAKEQRLVEQQTRQRQLEIQAHIASLPTPEAFELNFAEHLAAQLTEWQIPLPPRPLFNHMVAIARRSYTASLPNVASEAALNLQPVELAKRHVNAFSHFCAALPVLEAESPLHALTTEAWRSIQNVPELIERMTGTGDPIYQHNQIAISDQELTMRDRKVGKVLQITDYDADMSERIDSFLRDHPYHKLFYAPITISLPQHVRTEHQLIVASSGHGKSQLLELMILNDMMQPNPPGLIIIDSKPDMVARLERLAVFDGPLKNRLVVVNPREAPALNPFSLNLSVLPEEQVSQITSELTYFFRSLLGSELSSTMGVALRPLIQLMAVHEGATLNTLLDAIDNIDRFAQDFPKLSPTVQRFFENDFKKIIGKETVNAVKRRIYEIGTLSPTFERMFNAKTNDLDLVSALDEGKIVLVSTEVGFLHELSPVFGKYIIAQLIAAALRRKNKGRAAYLYIDEAGPYTDEDKTEQLFSTLRSHGLGAIVAFQHWEQLSAKLQQTVRTNTSIKFIGGEDNSTARMFAADMRTTADFVFNQSKDTSNPPHFTYYAAYIKAHTPSALSVRVPFYALDAYPKRPGPPRFAAGVAPRIEILPPVKTAAPNRPFDADPDIAPKKW